jgi:hypothetical protein
MGKLKAFNQRFNVLDKPGEVEPILGVGGPEGASSGRGVKLSTTVRERQNNTMRCELEQVARSKAKTSGLIQEKLAKFFNKRFNAATKIMAEAAKDILTFTAFPSPYGGRYGPTKLPGEVQTRDQAPYRRRWRTIFNRPAIVRLVDARMAEQNDELTATRRYMSTNALEQAQADHLIIERVISRRSAARSLLISRMAQPPYTA